MIITKSQNELQRAYLFAQLSKIITSDQKLIKFYGLRDKGKWNDLESTEKKQQIIQLLRELACQQQELLKYRTTKVIDISFDSIKHKEILEDNIIVRIYLKSQILFNQRELLPRVRNTDLLSFSMALKYIEMVDSKVIAITRDFAYCSSDLLPGMIQKEFWGGKSVLITDNISYFPTFTGANIMLASEMLKKGNIILSL